MKNYPDRDPRLSPCPWCGCVNTYTMLASYTRAWIAGCPDCGASTGWSQKSEEDAIRSWNRVAGYLIGGWKEV